jgi:Ca2+/Na+ antiporter
MAVSSSIGSNVFDILVGLPVPWIISYHINGGKDVNNDGLDDGITQINSPYVVVQVILLLGMVFTVIGCIIKLDWTLNKKLGGVMGGLYIFFLLFSIWLETSQPSYMQL